MKNVDLRELALKKVKITGNVIGKFGTFEIEQMYKNNTKEVLEVGYTFPIVETATVVGFEIKVGDKILKGKCKEKGEAKREYQQNIVKGNSAYMMEQETGNIFKISVGKIDKDEEVTVKIQYIDKFEIIDNQIEILIPTLVTPRYKSNVTNKLIYGKTNYTVDFTINIDKTLNVENINCPSHKINIIDEKNIKVENYDLSKDFKLDIKLKNELSSKAIISKTRDGKDMLYLSFMPEIDDVYEDSEKEYLFLIDISGSMMGVKLEETKRAVIECLKQLDEGDKFNIIAFDHEFEVMSAHAIEYNEKNMQEAERYINSLHAAGGTEILNPIKFALYENTEKVILLFTDGQVGNEKQIIDFVKEHGKNSRIFPFGIDSNVNSYFIKQLAKAGNGKAELIQPNEKIDDKIIRTFARIQTPMVESIQVDYGQNKLVDEIKEENSLFNYEFFNVFAKIEEIKDDIELKGKILGKEYTWKIAKEEITNTDVALEVLFAKQEIERLEDYIKNTYDYEKIENYKKMIIDIAVKYNINSEYTSFITVYERENKLLDVPQYQETTLSNKFMFDAFEGIDATDYECEESFSGSAQRMFNTSNLFGASADTHSVKGSTKGSEALNIPSFMKRSRVISPKYEEALRWDAKNHETTELLDEKINEYYEKFIKQEEKSILTYLLYALYDFNKGAQKIDYERLVQFLEAHKQEIRKSELYMQLICRYYKDMEINFIGNREKLLNIIDEDYKKLILTNAKIRIYKNVITEKEVEQIIKENKISENIDDVIWYLYSKMVSIIFENVLKFFIY